MASSSRQTSFSTHDLIRLGCIRLNDNVYELHKPASGPISAEIVFFHGFQTRGCEDAFIRTWMTRDGTACWLNTWLVACIPEAHILSVSYDSSTRTSDCQGRVDMYLIRENLVRALIEIVGIGQNCPVVLVGHCVGGLVVKEICLKASLIGMQEDSAGQRHRKFLANVKGMFFYSTAHLGSLIPLTTNPNQGPLLEYFYSLNKGSARINDEFAKLRRRYDWKAYGVNEANETRTRMLMPFCDHEIIPGLESSSSSEYLLVVQEAAARYDVDKFATIPGVDHFTICSPKDQQSNSFLLLLHFLEEILKEEEKGNADLQRCLQLPSKLTHAEDRIHNVTKLLDLQNPEPMRLSLVGMDGIGKSTLAKQILSRIQHQFEFTCFLELEYVPEKPRWRDLEEMVAENLYKGSGRKVSLREGTPWSLLTGKKLLIFVDDVESKDQIRTLVDSNLCGRGSRLIITTSKKNLLSEFDFIDYDVPLLSRLKSMELFEAHVEGQVLQAIPKELVFQVLDECEGLPLTLELLGCYLRKKNDVLVWRGALERLRTANALDGEGENRLWRRLRVIFDYLNGSEKKIFLDLATFDLFGPEKQQYDLSILKTAWRTGLRAYGSSTDMAIENLRDRCFLKIVPGSSRTVHMQINKDDDVYTVYIHKVLRNMGKWISGPLNEEVELQNCTRLWQLEDVMYVLNQSKGEIAQNKLLEALSVAVEPYELSLSCLDTMKWSSIGRFDALRLLRLSNVNMEKGSNEFTLPQGLAMLHMINCRGPQQRRWCPWWQPDWPILEENVKNLGQLSVLVLDNCSPVRLPKNFHELKRLRILHLRDNGTDIMQLPETFGYLPVLEELSLSAPVKKLPGSILALSSLRSIKLSNCLMLNAWPIATIVDSSSHLTSLTSLQLAELPALTHLPNTFGGLSSLDKLSLERCPALVSLPEGFGGLQRLTRLHIRSCESLESLCESFHNLSKLEYLELDKLPALRTLPNKFGRLPSLRSMYMMKCVALQALPLSFIDIQPLTSLCILQCESLVSLWQDPGHSLLDCKDRRLEYLELRGCPRLQGLPESLGKFNALRKMNIYHCERLEYFPGSVMQITSLKSLEIGGCRNLVQLPEVTRQLSSLTAVTLNNCPNLICLPESMSELKSLEKMEIRLCQNLLTLPESLGLLTLLQELTLESCENLPALPESLGHLKRLEQLTIEDCGNLVALPESIGQLTSLQYLTLKHCGNLVTLPVSFGELTSLIQLIIENCQKLVTLPESVGHLPALATLHLANLKNFASLPETVGHITSLIDVVIHRCESLARLPESMRHLRSLMALGVFSCGVFEDFPVFIGQLTGLQLLSLPDCTNQRSLPYTLEQLKELQQLGIRSSRIQSIKGLPESLKVLVRLSHLAIFGTGHFEGLLDSLWQLTSLRTLILDDCESLEEIPESIGQQPNLEIVAVQNYSRLRELPRTLGQLGALQELYIQNCASLKTLPESTGQLKSLTKLIIEKCETLEGLPEALGQLSRLNHLAIETCKSLSELPKSLRLLGKLRQFVIGDCENLKTLPEFTEQLKSLHVFGIEKCDKLEGLPESLGKLPVLNRLTIENCRGIRELPKSLGQLQELRELIISGCENFRTLPESTGQLQSLSKITIENCYSFEKVPESLRKLAMHNDVLEVKNCRNFRNFL